MNLQTTIAGVTFRICYDSLRHFWFRYGVCGICRFKPSRCSGDKRCCQCALAGQSHAQSGRGLWRYAQCHWSPESGHRCFYGERYSFLKQYDTRVIVNVCGKTVEDYVEVVEKLGEEQTVAMLEINVSCPNVKEGAIAFGQRADALYNITAELKKHAKQPIIMKLSPNVTDITEMAKAAEAAGADALSLINTLTGMKIDVHKRRFAIANKTGGMSGPAIKPIAVRMVYQTAKAVKIPIIGMGGIATAEDAMEFILAGATAVSVGAMNFVDPYATVKVIEGIEEYMRTYQVEDIVSLIGAVE